MIVLKAWTKGHGRQAVLYKGWFLFGFIPLFIIRVTLGGKP